MNCNSSNSKGKSYNPKLPKICLRAWAWGNDGTF